MESLIKVVREAGLPAHQKQQLSKNVNRDFVKAGFIVPVLKVKFWEFCQQESISIQHWHFHIPVTHDLL